MPWMQNDKSQLITVETRLIVALMTVCNSEESIEDTMPQSCLMQSNSKLQTISLRLGMASSTIAVKHMAAKLPAMPEKPRMHLMRKGKHEENRYTGTYEKKRVTNLRAQSSGPSGWV